MADPRGEKTALDVAVAAARQRELAEQPRQLALFHAAPGSTESGSPAAEPGATLASRGPGRPPGARNRRTDEAARIYMSEFGDPLRRGVAISALPILAPDVLEGLARRLACSKIEAAKWWAGIYAATMPYVLTRLATLEVKPAGSLGGETVPFAFSEAGEIIEIAPAEPRDS